VLDFDAREHLRVQEVQPVDVEHLPPQRVHPPLGIGAEQPMQAGLKDVITPPPAGRQPSGIVVLLHHLDVITTFLPIDRRAEPGNATADDDNLARSPCHARQFLSRICALSAAGNRGEGCAPRFPGL